MSANIPNVLLNNSPSSASFLNLHFDILVLLASHLERSDLLSLMRVCRSLHAALVPHLLRSHPVIQRTKQLLSFSQFVMTDAPMRFVYLQRLSIAISYVWSKRIVEMLCTVFQYSTHLEELGILDCGCLEDPEIPSAIAALTSIRTLLLRYPTQAARDMLHQMRSQLTRVEVSFSKVPRHYMDPIELLASCHESLATLCMSLPRFSEVRLGLQYPALTKLVLKCHQAIHAAPLLYHYPNVHHFTVTMCEGQCGHGGLQPEHIRRDDADIEEMRAVNTLDRAYSWKTLDVLRGDVPSIYHLSLNCPVHRLEILEVEAKDISRFGKVMMDMKPNALEVIVKASSFNVDVLPPLMRHMPMELHSLKFDIEVDELTGQVKASMDDTFSVRIPSLVYFSLHWTVGFLIPEEEEEALANINWEAYARRFAQLNPALRFIALSRPFDGEIVAWQVSRSDQYYTDPIILSTLSPTIARQIMVEQC